MARRLAMVYGHNVTLEKLMPRREESMGGMAYQKQLP